MSKESRCLARLDEDREHKIGPISSSGPLRRATFPSRIGLPEVGAGNNAKDVVGSVTPLLHPRCDVATAGDFPVVDTWCVAEGFELMADPVRPLAIAARIADENIGHAAKPSHGTAKRGKSIFVLICATCNPAFTQIAD